MRISLVLVGSKGTAEAVRGGFGAGRFEFLVQYKLSQQPGALQPGQQHPDDTVSKVLPLSGVQREVQEFASLVRDSAEGKSTASGTGASGWHALDPEQGFQDLAVIQALLLSAEEGGAKQQVQQL